MHGFMALPDFKCVSLEKYKRTTCKQPAAADLSSLLTSCFDPNSATGGCAVCYHRHSRRLRERWSWGRTSNTGLSRVNHTKVPILSHLHGADALCPARCFLACIYVFSACLCSCLHTIGICSWTSSFMCSLCNYFSFKHFC